MFTVDVKQQYNTIKKKCVFVITFLSLHINDLSFRIGALLARYFSDFIVDYPLPSCPDWLQVVASLSSVLVLYNLYNILQF